MLVRFDGKPGLGIFLVRRSVHSEADPWSPAVLEIQVGVLDEITTVNGCFGSVEPALACLDSGKLSLSEAGLF